MNELISNDQVPPLSKRQIQTHWKQVKKDKKEWNRSQLQNGILHIPYLDFFSYNLNQAVARKPGIKYAVGRRNKIRQIEKILTHRDLNTPMLVGDAGVGKTDIVEGLADAINKRKVPKDLQGYQIRNLDLGLLHNNMQTGANGYLVSNFDHILRECQTYRDHIILFIDEFHMLMDINRRNVGQQLKKPLGRGTMKLIGATTNDEYYDFVLPDRAMQRRLDKIEVTEPSKATTVKILQNNIQQYSKHYHGVTISLPAIKTIVELAARYMTDQYFPSKAFSVLDDTLSEAYFRHQKQANIFDVEIAIYDKTHVPLESLRRALQPQVANLSNELGKYIKGQPEAIKEVVNAVNQSFVGFNNPNQPVASMLFLGPTGTGKTEMARALARALFGDPDAMIRLDMASYNTPDATAKLLGANGKRGSLTEAVRRQPYGILLLDEIEKSTDDVWNLLLSILDAGRIQDSRGRTVNFTNEIIIMTSNLGASQIEHRAIFNPEPHADRNEKIYYKGLFNTVIEDTLKRTFRPELVNRLSNRVIFNSLNKGDVIKIAQKEIKIVLDRVNSRGYDFTFDWKTINYLAHLGTSIQDGARPMERAIHQHILGPMSTKIIKMRASSEWNTKYKNYKTFYFYTTGKIPTKHDRWGTRQLHIQVTNKPLTQQQKEERHNVFSDSNIKKMLTINKSLQQAQHSAKNTVIGKIKALDRKRSAMRL